LGRVREDEKNRRGRDKKRQDIEISTVINEMKMRG
jgi:hypothetical protein